MKPIQFPTPIKSLPNQQSIFYLCLEDVGSVCVSTPLFEDYKYGDTCIVNWDQMQIVSDYKHLFAKTLQKFETPNFISV